MQLENPAQRRRLVDVIAALPDSDRTNVVRRLASLDRRITRRHKQDADLVDALLRILKSPNPQAQRLRELVADIVTKEIKANG